MAVQEELGAVAKWQGMGLQNPHRRFDSASRLQILQYPIIRWAAIGGVSSPRGRRFQRLHVARDFGRDFILGHFQFVACLQIHPKGGAVLENNVSIWCGHFSSSFDGGPRLSEKILKALGDLGLPLWIDTYSTTKQSWERTSLDLGIGG